MPVPEFSQMLTERRRQLGYSVGQAARALRLKESVLEAFESGDFASMPKSGYAQGMLSSYARFLGLDAQVVTDLFAESLAEWRSDTMGAGARRGQRGATRQQGAGTRRPQQSRQPQVPRRGLLPTAGGIAGDLGDYATTSSARPHERDRSYGTGGPASQRGYGQDVRSRRSERASGEALRRRSRSQGRDDVTTVPVSSEYVDDLRFGNNASPYDPASSERGRASYRNLASTERPQVQRRPSSRQRQQVRGRGRRQQPQTFAEKLTADPVRFIALIVVLVAVIITLILVLAISSCSFGSARGDGDRSVPVSQTTTNSSTNEGSTASNASNNANDKSQEDAAAARQIASANANTGNGADSNTATVVEVSVADGSVTWLEIECDGSSKVAETVTGPWDQTYTVTESITIQVGDTTAVTVTKNGKQMQFDSRASGLGTMTIQGTKVQTSQTSASSGTNSTRTTTANGSEASNGSGSAGAAASSGRSDGTSNASGASANAGPDATAAASSGNAASGTGSGPSGGASSASGGGTGSSGSRSSASLGRAGSGASSGSYSDGSSDYSDGDSSSGYGSSDGYSDSYDYSDSAY